MFAPSRLLFRLIVPSLLASALILIASIATYGQEVKYYRATESAEHDHFVVSVGGVPAIIIRAHPEFPDTESRARDTAQKLGEAFNKLRVSLSKYQKPVAGFAIEDCTGTPCIDLMGTSFFKVTGGDAAGYRSRDHHGRAIDSRIVAEYWRALLQDIALLNNAQEPTTLREFDETKILGDIYRSAKEQGGDESAVNKAIASLNEDQRKALEGLAYQIPHDFHLPTHEISSIQPPKGKAEVTSGGAVAAPQRSVTPEASGLSQTAVSIVKKILGVFALLILFGVLFVFGRRIFGSKRISLTLALNAGERELESKEFVLQPLEEISLRQTGGDQRWAVGSPDSIRNVSGKLFRISSDGNPPERLRVGSQIKIPPDGPVQRALAVKALGRA